MLDDPIAQGIKILLYSGLAFFIAILWAPLLISILNQLKFWKKSSRKVATTGEELTVTRKFYEENEESVKRKFIPRGGGILIWATTIAFALFFWIILQFDLTNSSFQFLNFIDRKETFIPLGTLFFASLVGLIDDTLSTLESGGNYIAGGLKLSHRLILVTIMGAFIGYWFYFKLDLTSITLPWLDIFHNQWLTIDLKDMVLPFIGTIGWVIIPMAIVILVTIWGTSIVDGFDGLATGIFIPVFLCFAGLAYVDGFYDIATLLMVMVGTMWAYLWFNVPPAKFFLGDTGTMGILLTLGVVAILLDKIYVLPIAGFILYATELSAIIQVFSKKFLKRKILLAAPLHHHLEAIGWTKEQITMRFWMISMITSILGFALGVLIN
jgi:phospho-N-acetylmuramoyl-pentapeptide-transferase